MTPWCQWQPPPGHDHHLPEGQACQEPLEPGGQEAEPGGQRCGSPSVVPGRCRRSVGLARVQVALGGDWDQQAVAARLRQLGHHGKRAPAPSRSTGLCLPAGTAAETAPCFWGYEAGTQAAAPATTFSASGEPAASTQPPRHSRCRPAYALTAKETRPPPAPLARPVAGRQLLRLHSNAGLALALPGLSPHTIPRLHRSILEARAPSYHWHPHTEGRHQRGFPTFAQGSALATGLPLHQCPASPCARRPAVLPAAPLQKRKGSLPPARQSMPERAVCLQAPQEEGAWRGSLQPNPAPGCQPHWGAGAGLVLPYSATGSGPGRSPGTCPAALPAREVAPPGTGEEGQGGTTQPRSSSAPLQGPQMPARSQMILPGCEAATAAAVGLAAPRHRREGKGRLPQHPCSWRKQGTNMPWGRSSGRTGSNSQAV